MTTVDSPVTLADQVRIYGMMLTPFRTDLSLDEDALRELLRRAASAGTGVVMSSPSNGEGYALTVQEHRRIYEIAVEECKGTVPVWANTRGARTPADAYELVKAAKEAGIEEVDLYQCQAGNVLLSVREQEAYWDELLPQVDIPVNISLNPQISGGYVAPLSLMQRIIARYECVVGLCCYLRGAQFLAWRREIPARIKMISIIDNFARGACGSIETGPNVIPRTMQEIADGWNAGDIRRFAAAAQTWERFRFIAYGGWATETNTARWTKTALKVLGLGNGVMRPPLMLPSEEEQRTTAEALDRVGVAEWNELRAASGVRGTVTEGPGPQVVGYDVYQKTFSYP